MTGLKNALGLGWFMLSLGAGAPAWAIPITVSFTADFSSGPNATISGSFDYNAASVTSNDITSLNSVSLTIDGHTYSVSEFGTQMLGPYAIIGTLANGVDTVASDTNDFSISFDPGTGSLLDFNYGAPGAIYGPSSITQFSITADTATPVPEPGSFTVFLTGIAAMGVAVAHQRGFSWLALFRCRYGKSMAA